ncbi:hypothetical protein VC83_05600 [Pseudogymnoascus destructans]|uniref:Uncharacterized protein n=2 Tax=Pseudogymnoascus destructans TaxID=655981 RepID=L8G7G8_PSED2|nr:uncharacterized protein VC83_05600 [Pseudogymnoascus destructans]ELR09155.1 hypothetical protein GMDG_03733 [Pseudogymnoascus destructans 20631-21]OAF57661.1 hypothetical protein VC83_05600 [Pseudogymnoascus destructans]
MATTKASGLKATEDLAAVAPANTLTTTTTTTTTTTMTEAGAAPTTTDEAASESTVLTPTSTATDTTSTALTATLTSDKPSVPPKSPMTTPTSPPPDPVSSQVRPSTAPELAACPSPATPARPATAVRSLPRPIVLDSPTQGQQMALQLLQSGLLEEPHRSCALAGLIALPNARHLEFRALNSNDPPNL